MVKTKKRIIILIIAAAFLVALVAFFHWQNNGLTTTYTAHASAEIPSEFDGFTIVQVSDLHNKRFGSEQKVLLSAIEEAKPDVILITGDIVDRRRFDMEPALELVVGATKIAPVYYVSGNHEAWSGQYDTLRTVFEDAGAYILDDAAVTLKRSNEKITLLGLSDPDFFTDSYLEGTDTTHMEAQLKEWSQTEGFTVLLSHRPELIELYARYNIDLVFSGHAHGGQFRLGALGGLYAPDQGFFPKYTSRNYLVKGTTMFVSRGLGNSLFPVRLFNQPELVVVELKTS